MIFPSWRNCIIFTTVAPLRPSGEGHDDSSTFAREHGRVRGPVHGRPLPSGAQGLWPRVPVARTGECRRENRPHGRNVARPGSSALKNNGPTVLGVQLAAAPKRPPCVAGVRCVNRPQRSRSHPPADRNDQKFAGRTANGDQAGEHIFQFEARGCGIKGRGRTVHLGSGRASIHFRHASARRGSRRMARGSLVRRRAPRGRSDVAS